MATADTRGACELARNNYGDVPLEELLSETELNSDAWPWKKAVNGKKRTKIGELTEWLEDQEVLIRGHVHKIRPVSSKLTFVLLKQTGFGGFTVQCVVSQTDSVSSHMVKFCSSLSRESLVEVIGVVSVPGVAVTGASQQIEIHVRKLYCIHRAEPLPISIEDASRSENEIEKALQEGKQLPRVNQDTRLDNRVLDIRTPANQAIFRIAYCVVEIFREFLKGEGFLGLHTPTINAGSSEGGSAVFKLDYKGRPACLAQSPQLHKQMSICGYFARVFAIGPVYRAEDSYTHRHLCEFISLDVEMEIIEHYSEVMDIVSRLFVTIFDKLNEECKKELEAVGNQYPFEPLKYKKETLRLPFEEGIQMLKDAGVEIDPLEDLNTESERKLGKLVAEKYGTEFYILYRYPLSARPFYTMPSYEYPGYSNSFDVFIRGEEIISGGQRIHVPGLLEERARACGIDLESESMFTYIKSFSYGADPHGGFAAGLERVVMLFCGLDNIRKTSLFPRDPTRLVP